MSKHVDRFSGRVEEYAKHRLHYPPEVLNLLQERCGLRSNDVIADVGAGTGMLSELFLEHGNKVIAIEPNDAMRVECMRLKKRYPRLVLVDATAEETTLGNASVDFVSAGRAFHWFDPVKAMSEFSRVLRSKGWVVLVASGRSDTGTARAMEFEQILQKQGLDYHDVRSRHAKHEEAAAVFAPGSLVQEQIAGEQRLTLAEFLGQTQSYSSVPRLGDEGYETMQLALRDYFSRWQEDGWLRMATTCLVTCGQLPSIGA